MHSVTPLLSTQMRPSLGQGKRPKLCDTFGKGLVITHSIVLYLLAANHQRLPRALFSSRICSCLIGGAKETFPGPWPWIWLCRIQTERFHLVSVVKLNPHFSKEPENSLTSPQQLYDFFFLSKIQRQSLKMLLKIVLNDFSRKHGRTLPGKWGSMFKVKNLKISE